MVLGSDEGWVLGSVGGILDGSNVGLEGVIADSAGQHLILKMVLRQVLLTADGTEDGVVD